MNTLLKQILLPMMLLSYKVVYAEVTFDEALKLLEQHPSVLVQKKITKMIKQQALNAGSWGDPVFRLAAKSYPVDSLRGDLSPMSGIEIGLSQKIAVTNRYGKMKHSYAELANAQDANSEEKLKQLKVTLWSELIRIEQLNKDRNVLNENIVWVKQSLKISEKLYALGKVSQQSVMQIQLKRDGLLRKKLVIENSIDESWQKIKYLTGGKRVRLSSIKWNKLENTFTAIDFRNRQLEYKIKASALELAAERLRNIPDITLSASYTKRKNLDGLGDMVTLGISMPLPFSDVSTSKVAQSRYSYEQKKIEQQNYLQQKKSELEILKRSLTNLQKRLSLLQNSSIPSAEQARKITFKLYERGKSSYLDLLNAYEKNLALELEKHSLVANMRLDRVKLSALTEMDKGYKSEK